jgi:hypothetical protein
LFLNDSHPLLALQKEPCLLRALLQRKLKYVACSREQSGRIHIPRPMRKMKNKPNTNRKYAGANNAMPNTHRS